MPPRTRSSTVWVLAGIGWLLAASVLRAAPPDDLVGLAGEQLRIGLSPASGALSELITPSDGYNQLAECPSPWALWQIGVVDGEVSRDLSSDRAGKPQIERLSDGPPGLRLRWDRVAIEGHEPLRVEVVVRLAQDGAPLSRWELSVTKPTSVRLKDVRFPRVANLRPRADEMLAVPRVLGNLARDPRALLQGKSKKGVRLSWEYPFPLTVQCLAFYQQDGPGFYAACDDAQGFRKKFELWGDSQRRVCFEVRHEPEQGAAGVSELRLPFAVVLGAFRGDWTTAAQLYRQSPASQEIAQRGRLRRQLTPAWVPQTGLWLWNRGRSQQVLEPAAVMRKHLQAPVSVLWHWWHNCPYDAGFPEYLPPREGSEPFQAAIAAARQNDVHAILYMNQRLWGTQTRSWESEGAESYAVKGKDGKVRTETYNVFMKAPCAPMCIGTSFWRDKYAGLAQEVLCNLKADGVYMDQVGCQADCYDPGHGHIPGPGRYWTDGLTSLCEKIRAATASRGPVALGGEYCGEPWIGHIDLMLGLNVCPERMGTGSDWEPIPFYMAVYHSSAVVFGNMAGLAHPPYDEKWPPELAPPNRLALLDRKFARQFCLEHARTFVWGMQPMLANFLPAHLQQCPEEIDFVTRLVRTRMHALKYLLHGTWLRPPPIDVPAEEIDIAAIGTYKPLAAARRSYPVVLAGAWRAADGNVAVALAGFHGQSLRLRLPIDAKAYGFRGPCPVYRIDENGRKPLGQFDPARPDVPLDLPPRSICLIEFCINEKP